MYVVDVAVAASSVAKSQLTETRPIRPRVINIVTQRAVVVYLFWLCC